MYMYMYMYMVYMEYVLIFRWRPDPDAPFQTPSHLRDAIQEFERSEVPNMGLRPHAVPAGGKEETQSEDQSSEDLEFIYSYVLVQLLQPTVITIETLNLLHVLYMYMYTCTQS